MFLKIMLVFLLIYTNNWEVSLEILYHFDRLPYFALATTAFFDEFPDPAFAFFGRLQGVQLCGLFFHHEFCRACAALGQLFLGMQGKHLMWCRPKQHVKGSHVTKISTAEQLQGYWNLGFQLINKLYSSLNKIKVYCFAVLESAY